MVRWRARMRSFIGFISKRIMCACVGVDFVSTSDLACLVFASLL